MQQNHDDMLDMLENYNQLGKKLEKKIKKNSSKISNTAQMLLIIIFVEMQVISNLYCKLNMMTMRVKFLCQHAN